MPEKPKEKKDKDCKAEDLPEKDSENGDKDSWSSDQKEKSYYYDDSHGYEIYNPDEDDEEDSD